MWKWLVATRTGRIVGTLNHNIMCYLENSWRGVNYRDCNLWPRISVTKRAGIYPPGTSLINAVDLNTTFKRKPADCFWECRRLRCLRYWMTSLIMERKIQRAKSILWWDLMGTMIHGIQRTFRSGRSGEYYWQWPMEPRLLLVRQVYTYRFHDELWWH